MPKYIAQKVKHKAKFSASGENKAEFHGTTRRPTYGPTLRPTHSTTPSFNYKAEFFPKEKFKAEISARADLINTF